MSCPNSPRPGAKAEASKETPCKDEEEDSGYKTPTQNEGEECISPELLFQMNKKIAQLTKVVYGLNTRGEELEAQLHKSRDNEQRTRALNGDLQHRVNNFKSKIENEMTKLQDLESQAKQAHLWKREYENLKLRYEAELPGLESAGIVGHLRHELEQEKINQNSLQFELDQARHVVANLKSHHDFIMRERDSQQLMENEKLILEWNTKLNDVEARYKTEIRHVNDELEIVKKEKNKLKIEYEKFKLENQRLTLNELELQKLKTDREKLKSELENQTKIGNQKLITENNKLKNELKTKNFDLQYTETQNVQNQKLLTENNQLKTDLERLQYETEKLKSESNKLKTELETEKIRRQTEIQSLNQIQIATSGNELATSGNEIKLKEELENLKLKLTRSIQEYQKSISEAKNEHERERNDLINEKHETVNEKHETVQRMCGKIHEREKQIKELNYKMSEMEANFNEKILDLTTNQKILQRLLDDKEDELEAEKKIKLVQNQNNLAGNDDYLAEKEEFNDEIRRLKTENLRLESEATSVRLSSDNASLALVTRVQTLEDELQEKNSELELRYKNFKVRLNMVENENKQYVQEKVDVERKLEDERERNKIKLKNQEELHERNILQLRSELDQISDSERNLKELNKIIEVGNEKFKEEKEELSKKLKDVERDWKNQLENDIAVTESKVKAKTEKFWTEKLKQSEENSANDMRRVQDARKRRESSFKHEIEVAQNASLEANNHSEELEQKLRQSRLSEEEKENNLQAALNQINELKIKEERIVQDNLNEKLALLQTHEDQISALNSKVCATERALNESERQLNATERELIAIERELKDKKRELNDKFRVLDDKKRELDEKKRELVEKERELNDKKRESDDKSRELDNKNREFTDKDRVLNETKRELEDKKRELCSKERELHNAKQESSIVRKKTENSREKSLQKNIEDLDNQIKIKDREHTRLKTEVSNYKKDVENERTKALKVTREIEDLRQKLNVESSKKDEDKTNSSSKFEAELRQSETIRKKLEETINSVEMERDEEMKIVQDALDEAAQEREDLINTFKKELETLNTKNIAREQQMLDDFEWKLREMEQSYKKKIEEKNTSFESQLNTVRSMVESEMAESLTRVAEDRRIADEKLAEVGHLRSYEAEVTQLRGLTHEFQKALRASAREMESFKIRERILEEEVKSLKTGAQSRQGTLSRIKCQNNNNNNVDEEEVKQRIEKVKNEVDAQWEDRMREQSSKLKKELSELYTEEKRLAIHSIEIQKEQQLDSVKKALEQRQAQLEVEVSVITELKDALAEKEVSHYSELEKQRTHSDREIWALRMKLQKLHDNSGQTEEKYVEELENLKRERTLTNKKLEQVEKNVEKKLAKEHGTQLEHIEQQHILSMARLKEELESEKNQSLEELRSLFTSENRKIEDDFMSKNRQLLENLEQVQMELELTKTELINCNSVLETVQTELDARKRQNKNFEASSICESGENFCSDSGNSLSPGRKGLNSSNISALSNVSKENNRPSCARISNNCNSGPQFESVNSNSETPDSISQVSNCDNISLSENEKFEKSEEEKLVNKIQDSSEISNHSDSSSFDSKSNLLPSECELLPSNSDSPNSYRHSVSRSSCQIGHNSESNENFQCSNSISEHSCARNSPEEIDEEQSEKRTVSSEEEGDLEEYLRSSNSSTQSSFIDIQNASMQQHSGTKCSDKVPDINLKVDTAATHEYSRDNSDFPQSSTESSAQGSSFDVRYSESGSSKQHSSFGISEIQPDNVSVELSQAEQDEYSIHDNKLKASSLQNIDECGSLETHNGLRSENVKPGIIGTSDNINSALIEYENIDPSICASESLSPPIQDVQVASGKSFSALEDVNLPKTDDRPTSEAIHSIAEDFSKPQNKLTQDEYDENFKDCSSEIVCDNFQPGYTSSQESSHINFESKLSQDSHEGINYSLSSSKTSEQSTNLKLENTASSNSEEVKKSLLSTSSHESRNEIVEDKISENSAESFHYSDSVSDSPEKSPSSAGKSDPQNKSTSGSSNSFFGKVFGVSWFGNYKGKENGRKGSKKN